jgi:hypothetical protein
MEQSKRNSSIRTWMALLAALATLVSLVACSGGVTSSSVGGGGTALTGTVTTTISDPPTCKGPLAPSDLQFDNVWVTVTQVRAHISGGAEDDDNGWVDLAVLEPPMQIDLLSGAVGQCALATLGIVGQLPAGNYQQIRLHLLANDATEGPANNHCEPVGGWNCAQESLGPLRLLELSSQAQTGLKIPPGRITGGALSLEQGQTADININFDACNSIVEQGDGGLRLLPTLHAGEVSLEDTIGGTLVKVVDEMGTTEPFTDLTGLVFLEEVDEDNIGRVRFTLQTSLDGSFGLCPVPEGEFEVVATGQDNAGVTYNPTITLSVSEGAALGEIPLVPEMDVGNGTGPGTIEGEVSTQDTGPSTAEIRLSPLQEVTKGSDTVLMTIPTFGASTLLFTTVSDGTGGTVCTDTVNTNCFNYTLMVPASDAQVGTFSAEGTTYSPTNATPEAEYHVLAEAFVPGTEGATDNCNPSSLITNNAVAVEPGGTVIAELLAFTGCQ